MTVASKRRKLSFSISNFVLKQIFENDSDNFSYENLVYGTRERERMKGSGSKKEKEEEMRYLKKRKFKLHVPNN